MSLENNLVTDGRELTKFHSKNLTCIKIHTFMEEKYHETHWFSKVETSVLKELSKN